MLLPVGVLSPFGSVRLAVWIGFNHPHIYSGWVWLSSYLFWIGSLFLKMYLCTFGSGRFFHRYVSDLVQHFWPMETFRLNAAIQSVQPLSSSLLPLPVPLTEHLHHCWPVSQKTTMFVIVAAPPHPLPLLLLLCWPDLPLSICLCVCLWEKGGGRDYMALQAAVKDDLWHHGVPDATVAAPDSTEWRRFGVRMREWIDLQGIEGGRKPKEW